MRIWFFLVLGFFIAVQPTLAADTAANLDEDLIYHVNFGSSEDIRVLLGRGANPNASSNLHDPVLAIAIARNDKEAAGMVAYLLEKGADPNQKDSAGNTPLALAIKNKQAATVAALVSKGANVHAVDSNGKTMLDLANATQDNAIIQPIKDVLDKEKALDSSLHSTDHFKDLIHSYSFNSCAYQYWSYFLASRQDISKNDKTQKKIAGVRSDLETIIHQIQLYFPSTKTADLQSISDNSAKLVFDDLESMGSNQVRANKDVGKEDDAKQRCTKIADGFKINFAPAEDKK